MRPVHALPSVSVRTAAMTRVALILGVSLLIPSSSAINAPIELSTAFRQQVNHRVDIPVAEQRRYTTLLQKALTDAGLKDAPAQYVVLVDRNALVQAAMIFWKSDSGEFVFIGLHRRLRASRAASNILRRRSASLHTRWRTPTSGPRARATNLGYSDTAERECASTTSAG
jgi:hypothetical protein